MKTKTIELENEGVTGNEFTCENCIRTFRASIDLKQHMKTCIKRNKKSKKPPDKSDEDDNTELPDTNDDINKTSENFTLLYK